MIYTKHAYVKIIAVSERRIINAENKERKRDGN